MTFEEASDMHMLHSISPELTCTCDEYHICQQCCEEMKHESDIQAHIDYMQSDEHWTELPTYQSNNMALYKNQGDPALTLAEECAEVIQVITKLYRFNGSWNEMPPGKDYTRWQELKSEMADLLDAWSQLYSEIEEDDDTE